MNLTHFRSILAIAAMTCVLFAGISASAEVSGTAGPYRLGIYTDPAVVPVGRATLKVRVAGANGAPVKNVHVRVLAQMPSMPMGEKESDATPDSSVPGTYSSPASFGMEGAFNVNVTITGPAGTAKGVLSLSTGQNTGGASVSPPSGGGTNYLPILIVIGIIALLVIALVMRRRTPGGEHGAGLSAGALGSLVMLAVLVAIAAYAVNHWRRPGAMTPLEAQGMQMETPAPPGTSPVTLASAVTATLQPTASYVGQAVGMNEVDVSARVAGWLTSAPLYAGSRVSASQEIARLDISQITPQIADRQAALAMAMREVDAARASVKQAEMEAHQAHGEAQMKEANIREANDNLTGAKEDASAAASTLEAAQSKVTDAGAQADSARADATYWQDELAREKALFDRGAVSRDEYQKEQSQAAGAQAKLRQAQAGISQMQSEVQAAQAAVRKSAAMVAAAGNRVDSGSAEFSSHSAHADAARSATQFAREKLLQAQDGVRQARAQLSAVETSRGYARVTAPFAGVVTQRIVSPGQFVNPGQTLIKLAQIRPIRLQANVPSSDLDRVRVGAWVEVRLQGREQSPIRVRVTSVTPAVDPGSRTGLVEALYGNPDGRVLPGQSLTMDVPIGTNAREVTVPVAAIQQRPGAGGAYVWVAKPNGEPNQYTVKLTVVRTGADNGERIQVRTGLKPGEVVVASGGENLNDGDTVFSKAASSGMEASK